MLKTVAVSSLRPGMFLHSVDRRWLDHPFWKNSFLLTAVDIEKIVAGGITSIVIDTDRGLSCSEDSLDEPVDLFDAGSSAVQAEDGQLLGTAVTTRAQLPRRQVGEEIEHARRLFESASNEMKGVFQQARMGRAVSGASMMPLVKSIAASVIRNPYALTSVARLKHHDGYTYMHSVAVCALMTALARELELDEPGVLEAGVAGLLHDLGKALMPGWAIDPAGRPTTDPTAGIAGGLLPLGGFGTENGGHKGYGLGLLADIFCAVLGGGVMAMDMPPSTHMLDPAITSHFFAAIRIDAFRDLATFKRDVSALLRAHRESAPAPGFEAVRVAGDPETAKALAQQRDGVGLDPVVVASLDRVAEKLAVAPPLRLQSR